MKLAALFLVLGVTATHAECSIDGISNALAVSLDAMKPLERDVSNIQSTEGGEWRIYREADGRVNSIVRIDYGETGRSELRLSIVNRRTYGIASTRFDYFHHIYDAGANGVARSATSYYYFCDGALQSPGSDEYSKDGIAARTSFFGDKDVADFTKGLVR